MIVQIRVMIDVDVSEADMAKRKTETPEERRVNAAQFVGLLAVESLVYGGGGGYKHTYHNGSTARIYEIIAPDSPEPEKSGTIAFGDPPTEEMAQSDTRLHPGTPRHVRARVKREMAAKDYQPDCDCTYCVATRGFMSHPKGALECCAGCDVCGYHCIPNCHSGNGVECTVKPAEECPERGAAEQCLENEAKETKVVIVAGDPFSGLGLIGPFDSHEEATEWAEHNKLYRNCHHWNVDLQNPKETDI